MGTGENRPVLLVEPDPDLREALLEALREQGYFCTAAASVDLDPAVLESVEPQLIILAPVELDLARRLLKQLDQRAAPPRVLLLVSHTLQDVLTTHPCVAGALKKPFDTEAFLETVGKHAAKK